MGNPKFGTPIFGFVSLLEKMPLKTNRYEYKFLIFGRWLNTVQPKLIKVSFRVIFTTVEICPSSRPERTKLSQKEWLKTINMGAELQFIL